MLLFTNISRFVQLWALNRNLFCRKLRHIHFKCFYKCLEITLYRAHVFLSYTRDSKRVARRYEMTWTGGLQQVNVERSRPVVSGKGRFSIWLIIRPLDIKKLVFEDYHRRFGHVGKELNVLSIRQFLVERNIIVTLFTWSCFVWEGSSREPVLKVWWPFRGP